MINPFIMNNHYEILAQKALSIISNAQSYVDINLNNIKYNLIFGKIIKHDGELKLDAYTGNYNNYSTLEYDVEYTYFTNLHKECALTIVIDLEQIYNHYGAAWFEHMILITFLHECRHIYQLSNDMYDIESNTTFNYNVNEYQELPWESDADKYAEMNINNISRIPFTII